MTTTATHGPPAAPETPPTPDTTASQIEILARIIVDDDEEMRAALNAAHVAPEAFDEALRPVVAAIHALRERGEAITFTTLHDATCATPDGRASWSVLDALLSTRLPNDETTAALVGRIAEAGLMRRARKASAELTRYIASAHATPAGIEAHLSALNTDLTAYQTAGAGDAEQWRPTIQSAHDLMRKDLPPVRWAVKDAIPEGLTLLAAKAKKGKSTLMLQVAVSIAHGAQAIGHFQTTQGEVLYLALEDNERRMQKRLRQMLQGEDAPAGLHFAYGPWPPLDRGGLEALETYLDEHSAVGVVIIDTLEHVRPARKGNGGYGDDYAAVRGLQRLAGQRQLAAVAITHLRKAPAEDPFDEINATMGLLASIDNALVMRSANGLMELHRRGRDFEDDSTLALKGDRETLLWRVEGQAQEVRRSSARKEIIAVLPDETAEKGMTPAEIALSLGKSREATRKLLYSLMHEPEPAITVDGRNGYHKLSNGGNGGNANPSEAQEPANVTDLWTRKSVTASVTALPMDDASGNAGDPQPDAPQATLLPPLPPLPCDTSSPSTVDLATARADLLTVAERLGWPACEIGQAERISGGETRWRRFTDGSALPDIERARAALLTTR